MKNNLLCIDEYRNNPEFYFSKSLRCADKNNLSAAFKNVQKAIELEPDNCEYKFNIACFLSEMRRPKEANRIFNDIILNYDPTMFDCFFGLGCNSLELDDISKAAEYFEKYLYFNNDGEFSEEVTEMIFYLKLYENMPQGSQFDRRSIASLRYAKKYFEDNKLNNAIRELYKSVSLHPFNLEARNLLTLALLEQRSYERANYVGMTVRLIDKYNMFANCLCLYVLSHEKKHKKVKRFLETLTLGNIECREDLLCAVTTLIVFNRADELIILLEMYITQYSDQLIFSALLLGYAFTRSVENFEKTYRILASLGKDNIELMAWLEDIKGYIYSNAIDDESIHVIDEYCKVYTICQEVRHPMYDPYRYRKIYSQISEPKTKISKKYLPIIECAINHREIMYIQSYKKEIICILNDCISHTKKPLDISKCNVEAYAAALEYNYCMLYYIECEKEELIQKYNISLVAFEKALREVKLNFNNKILY
ncbi:tetratricopeptide repeat protein [Ruminiclostridium herbifermentans]|uniref:Tetratricopeptide repeat protein n=1 Tax=Ruminiclostridium herbifermentans TaxID=2488810 RepID=A0A4V6EPN9_9FIRM|nr:tetratricopeptide repeat protein [Ruminiclostridium herbifermentans]QNU67590.1 tetratricopeptide repeat protein [Ruminiclostridium herbifermentans]